MPFFYITDIFISSFLVLIAAYAVGFPKKRMVGAGILILVLEQLAVQFFVFHKINVFTLQYGLGLLISLIIGVFLAVTIKRRAT